MKTLIIGLLVFGLCLGCAGQNLKGTPPLKEFNLFTLESLVEMSRTLPTDANGWRVLGVPDKDFANNYIEFIFFPRDFDWGAGFMQNGVAGSDIFLIYKGDTRQWYMGMGGQFVSCTPEEAKSGLIELWGIVKENGNFNKIRPFKLLEPTPKESI